jgi:phospholipase/carboxylesterase
MKRGMTALLLVGIVFVAGALSKRPHVPRLSALIKGGKGPPTVVLLHGYCSSESDWMPFLKTIQLPPDTRFVFPRGPESARRSDGGPDGRAWWHLDLSENMHKGVLGADLSAKNPVGIEVAAQAVQGLFKRRGNRTGQPFILGGFSQGAMVAAQVAFLSDEPLQALVLLSGTIVDETSWNANYARRKGMHVFVSHGRKDPILSFETADRMRNQMIDAGILVTWFPFDGGHETTSEVIVALNEFFTHL